VLNKQPIIFIDYSWDLNYSEPPTPPTFAHEKFRPLRGAYIRSIFFTTAVRLAALPYQKSTIGQWSDSSEDKDRRLRPQIVAQILPLCFDVQKILETKWGGEPNLMCSKKTEGNISRDLA